ncbi:hypothetical protein KAFR_0I02850 [Kazachstania africana CBS 2517]|uniref:Major facilitator superfamily (MFS) profile domain-containing protein n=1 Tax=Kazachstania africana (strain ATCC 22294 / BCRC 22015 / CBS 2517 / CECT 1963 / NBRC 1671 / NRRL Y-8276) TaxID=1071382 RepID=H2B0B4_KAZAF|nr:hypothetical protein KAFR_0I02850 [Kazachstania africana CBS 2517]CCF60064.1 hypothetical protein KAFR_0I02850 [Kazachstania africana CBS 2517]
MSGNESNMDQKPIEMQNLLDEPQQVKNAGQSTENLERNDNVVREIKWKEQVVKVYPLNYQEIPLVRNQIFCCLIMFLVFGFNDQSTGALIPTLVDEYNISEVKVANIFLVQLFGYTFASLCNETIHHHLGMRGGMLIAAMLCLVFFSILVSKPTSFYLYMACCLPLGLGIGILDASGNVLMGNLVVHKNEWMGILHAIYGVAAMLTPPIVNYFAEWGHWSFFFIIPLSLAIIGLIFIIPSFRYETAAKYDYTCNHGADVSTDGTESKESFVQLLRNPSILLYALYLFVYLGAEITTGAWFFTYLLTTKSADKIKMSYIASSYWLGLTSGRLLLGFVTKRAFSNEYRASKVYGALTFAFYALFFGVGLIDTNSNLYLTILFVIVFFCGFFIGPLFPSASIVALQVLPKRLHISGVGIAVAVGGCGGAALPYLAGLLTHLLGVQCIPFLCWIMVGMFNLIWWLYPKYIADHPEFL